VAYEVTDNPKTVSPLIEGVTMIAGVRTPSNELLIAAICWVTIGLLWLLINRTKIGKALLAASINPRGLTLLGFELSNIHLLVWTIYGVLAGIAGVLLATFLGASSAQAGLLTASAFSIVVLGGLGSVAGSLIAAYIVGYLETFTAYVISSQIRSMPALILLVVVVYVRPQGLLGRR
jgi:branched-chain amino acid transport system permease protein